MGLVKARSGGNGATFDPAPEDAPRLNHPDAMMRRRAVQALAGDAASVEALVDLLRSESDSLVRQAAFLALASLNSPDAARAVCVLLSDADAALRNGALETLAAMPDHAAPLLDALGLDGDPDVRIFAVLLAAELEAPAATDWLIALAARERDANVCSNLAEALGGTGRAEAATALTTIGARFADDPFLGFAVETALERLRGA